MRDNSLARMDGKKIRRQYFSAPIVFLCATALAVPYFVVTLMACYGKLDAAQLRSVLGVSALLFGVLLLPCLTLRTLNAHCFGKVLCVLTERGIYYPRGMLRWETIEKLEYAIDTKPRYPGDTATAFRAIIYTRGGQHVVVDHAPMRLLSGVRKYRRGLDIKVAGATSLLPAVLSVAAIILLTPFYLALFKSAPGAPKAQFIAAVGIWVVLAIVKNMLFDDLSISYLFWRRVLPHKWLYYVILWAQALSPFAAALILSYLPGWWTAALIGVWLALLPIQAQHGYRSVSLPSYDQMYDLYITRADFWKRNIAKRKKNP